MLRWLWRSHTPFLAVIPTHKMHVHLVYVSLHACLCIGSILECSPCSVWSTQGWCSEANAITVFLLRLFSAKSFVLWQNDVGHAFCKTEEHVISHGLSIAKFHPSIRRTSATTPKPQKPKKTVNFCSAPGPLPRKTSIKPLKTVNFCRAPGPLPRQTQLKPKKTVNCSRAPGLLPRQTPLKPKKTVNKSRASGPLPRQTPLKPKKTVNYSRAPGPLPRQTHLKPKKTVNKSRASGPLPRQTHLKPKKTVNFCLLLVPLGKHT